MRRISPAGERRHPRERPEDRSAATPGRPPRERIGAMTLTSWAWLAILHAVAVAQQRVEERADDDGVGHVVLVLDEPRVLAPAPPARSTCGWSSVSRPRWYQTFHSSKERSMCLLVLALRPDGVGRRDHRLDEVVHVDGAGQEAARRRRRAPGSRRAARRSRPRRRRAQHGLLPGAERRHAGVGGAARDQLDRRVDEAHRLGGLLGEPAVLVGGLVRRSATGRPSRCPGTTA